MGLANKMAPCFSEGTLDAEHLIRLSINLEIYLSQGDTISNNFFYRIIILIGSAVPTDDESILPNDMESSQDEKSFTGSEFINIRKLPLSQPNENDRKR